MSFLPQIRDIPPLRGGFRGVRGPLTYPSGEAPLNVKGASPDGYLQTALRIISIRRLVVLIRVVEVRADLEPRRPAHHARIRVRPRDDLAVQTPPPRLICSWSRLKSALYVNTRRFCRSFCLAISGAEFVDRKSNAKINLSATPWTARH